VVGIDLIDLEAGGIGERLRHSDAD
jgi:hypothetical protein